MRKIAAKVLKYEGNGDSKVDEGEPVVILDFCYDESRQAYASAIVMDARGRLYRIDTKDLEVTLTKELRECLAETSLSDSGGGGR